MAKKETPAVPTFTPQAVDSFSFPMVTAEERAIAIRAAMGQLNSKKKIIVHANEAPNTYELRRPTGIINVDVVLAGGFPAGSINEISGPDGTGKTNLALLICRMHQQLYGEHASIAYACTEMHFDYKRALEVGVAVPVPDEIIHQWELENIERGLPPYTEEQRIAFKRKVGEFQLIVGHVGEEILEVTTELVQLNMYGLIIVDSISALLPAANADRDLDEALKMAARATLLTNFVNKVQPILRDVSVANLTTIVLIGQARANNKKKYDWEPDWLPTSPYAVRHSSVFRLLLNRGSKIKKPVKGHKTDPVVGHVTRVHVDKAKAGARDGVVCEYEFYHQDYLPGGIEFEDLVVGAGIADGTLVKEGQKVELRQKDTGVVLYTHKGSMVGLTEVIKENRELFFTMYKEILHTHGITCLFR